MNFRSKENWSLLMILLTSNIVKSKFLVILLLIFLGSLKAFLAFSCAFCMTYVHSEDSKFKIHKMSRHFWVAMKLKDIFGLPKRFLDWLTECVWAECFPGSGEALLSMFHIHSIYFSKNIGESGLVDIKGALPIKSPSKSRSNHYYIHPWWHFRGNF